MFKANLKDNYLLRIWGISMTLILILTKTFKLNSFEGLFGQKFIFGLINSQLLD